MPTVPRLETTVKQQAFKTTVGNPNVGLEAFGGGASFEKVNQASENFTNTFGEIQKQASDRANKFVIEQADNETLRFKNDSFWNLQDGAITRKGKDSFGTVEEYGQKFDEFADKVEEGLSNDTQKEMYRLRRQDRKNELLDQLQKHTYSEGTKYQAEVIETKAMTIRDDVRLNYTEPGKIQSSIAEQKRLIDELGAANGQSPEWVELKKKEIESQTHTDVIKRMLSLGGDLNASNYFKQNKKALSGADTIALEGALEEGTIRGNSQRISDNLLSKYSDPTQILAETRNIRDPKLRDAVEQRVEHQISVRKSMESEARNNLYIDASNAIEANPGIPAREAVSPDVWSRFTPEQKRSLNSRSNDPSNDNKAWLDFLDMNGKDIATMNRADFETKYWSKFDSSHRAKAEGMWEAAKEGKGDKYAPLFNGQKQVLMAAQEARVGGIKMTDTLGDIKKSDGKIKALTEFQNQAENRFNQFYQDNKRNPTFEDKQKILKDLQTRVTIESPSWFRSDYQVQKYQLNEQTKPLAKVPIKEIPNEYQNAMFLLAKNNGLIPNQMTKDQAMIKLKKQYERAYGQGQFRKLSNSEVLSILREGVK